MNHLPQVWGRVRTCIGCWRESADIGLKPRDDVYGPYDPSYLGSNGPKTATQSPAVTGTSVIAAKFKDGVVIAADNLGPHHLLTIFNS